MNPQERIEIFNKEASPFYIVSHDDGTFSLCLLIDFLPCDDELYCQDAFDAYSVEVGEPVCKPNVLRTHGDGYDWQAAFQEAFKDDPHIGRILYDCEAGGFFCYCNDLELIADFGKRFKAICEDTERFTPIVSAGIRNAAIREAEEIKLMSTVKGQLMSKPKATFELMTPYGNIRVTPEMSQKLLAGEMSTVIIGDTRFADFELLDQPILKQQTDLFDTNLIRMKTDEAPEPEQAQTLMM